jgi:hypothetical protein
VRVKQQKKVSVKKSVNEVFPFSGKPLGNFLVHETDLYRAAPE